jgi:hypothetical protein
MRRIPAIWKVVKHDNATFLLASVGAIFVAMAVFVKMTGTIPSSRHADVHVDPRTATAILENTLLVVGVLWIPAAFRVLRIRDLFKSGNEVRATVRKIRRFKGYSTIDLDFLIGGRVCSSRSTIRRSAKARAIGPGSLVGVIVDPAKPSRLVLAELYD